MRWQYFLSAGTLVEVEFEVVAGECGDDGLLPPLLGVSVGEGTSCQFPEFLGEGEKLSCECHLE